MLLQLQNVTRFYKTVIGVNDITLELPAGAHGLLGPNGAGKSTFLNLITGQLSPSIGSLKVLGMSPRANQALLARIGFLPSTEGMYAEVSALEWVMYLTRIQGYSRAKAVNAAKVALDRVKLSDHMHRKISTFSRGMRQRARLAQAIAHEPEFLVLDEPFSGLDPVARHHMTTLLQEWIASGKSMLVSSHVLWEIESLTRSFMLISGGRLLASGATDDITQLLGDTPTELRIRCNDARQLAADLMVAKLSENIRILNDFELIATTSSARMMHEFLAAGAAAGTYAISEMRSTDDSLQDVFNQLMKIHRGVA